MDGQNFKPFSFSVMLKSTFYIHITDHSFSFCIYELSTYDIYFSCKQNTIHFYRTNRLIILQHADSKRVSYNRTLISYILHSVETLRNHQLEKSSLTRYINRSLSTLMHAFIDVLPPFCTTSLHTSKEEKCGDRQCNNLLHTNTIQFV